MDKLKLNNEDCSIRLIENFLKVVHMTYLIEELEQEKSRIEEEKSRIEEEKSRLEQQNKALEKYNLKLRKILKEQGFSDEEIEVKIKSIKNEK